MQNTIINLRKKKGFTLIELLIAVAIVGILASIAYPNYSDYIIRSRREDAKGALMGLSNAMERHFTETNSYMKAAANNADTGRPGIFAQTSPVDGGKAYYNLNITAATQTSYTLRATPITGSGQDTNGFLEIQNTDAKGRWDQNNNNRLDTSETSWD
ncbi:MAG: type IV pilin protein [Methylococcales bacterium]|nr:type IV pilin protein [Methylococcales bacterium]